MSTGMTTWAVSPALTMESTKAGIRTMVASPLVEVDRAATKVNTGSTTALHTVAHMGYARFLTFWRFYFPQTGSRFVLRKVKIGYTSQFQCARSVLLGFVHCVGNSRRVYLVV